ncbi:LUD domain-containing protein [Nocardia sp. NPDC050710]|uniref:LutC/YkgG family protein n=1 Tax=Nocardia sp. NPDC050710 TaxID=3157220 RepID=UPI0033D403DA
MNSREELLRRIRDALIELPDDERLVPMSRAHRRHPSDPSSGDRTALVDLFAERLKHYGAQVYHLIEPDIPETVRTVLDLYGASSVVAPQGLPGDWLRAWAAEEEHHVIDDSPFLPPGELASADAVITTCAAAVADSGVIVLDGSAGQGRRAPTLAPDCHLCVVRTEQVGSTLLEVIDRLDHRRQITWFSGPTAGVDIDADAPDRHIPRRLIVLIVD